MDSVVRLSLEFSLSFPEIVSLLLGMETLPHQTYLSRIATLIMIQSPNEEKKKFLRGSLFGRCFAQILQSVFNTNQGSAGFRRYNYYVPRALPSPETWEGIVDRRMHLIMNLWKDYPEWPSKQQAISVMKSFTRDIEKTNVGTGKLASNHVTLVMSMLGVTPPWTADFAVITDKAKSIEWFNNQFAMKKPLKGVELDRMVSSLSRSLQQLCPTIRFTLRLMENVLCEAYREFSAEKPGACSIQRHASSQTIGVPTCWDECTISYNGWLQRGFGVSHF